MEFLAQLLNFGVVVFPVFDNQQIQQVNSAVESSLRSFTEVSNYEGYAQKPALANFGAVGTVSSFHHPTIRWLRKFIQRIILKLFSGFKLYGLEYVEILFDRIGCRVPKTQEWGGGSISGESWHRDQAPQEFMAELDQILGGWVNLNTNVTQGFVCIPGTHNTRADGSGFVKNFTPTEIEYFNQQKQLIEIPPGHAILFYQHILHMVRNYTIKQRELRLFLGIRFTKSINPLFDQTKAIEDQGIPTIPSGQTPKLYESNHPRFHKDKIQNWSTLFIPAMKTDNPALLLPAVSKSLREMSQLSGTNLMYEPYDQEDLQIMRPYPLN